VTRGDRNLRIFIVHVLLIILLLFFTSPLSILSAITSWINKVEWLNKMFNRAKGLTGTGSDLLLQYLPTLILLIVSNTLPYGMIFCFYSNFVALYYLSSVERYKSRSKVTRVNLLRLYVYLCLTTLSKYLVLYFLLFVVLPSLLQVSIDSIIQYTIKNDVTDIFYNLFLPAAGVFFVCYTLQYVLLGNTLDVLRITSFFKYLYRSFCKLLQIQYILNNQDAITQEEKEEALHVAEFDTGFEYSFLISFFAIIVAYSVFSPLMLAIGLAYSISKYVIDRHNITILCDKNTRAAHKVTLFSFLLTHQRLFMIYMRTAKRQNL
jgi:hypothetical protein